MIDSALFWQDLKTEFGNQKVFWGGKEKLEKPNVTDRLLHYVISYWENPEVARKAVRIFNGIDYDAYYFSGWNEVRVTTMRELNKVLKLSGAVGDTWELAITIKDLLENMWNSLHTVNLSEVLPEDQSLYIKQLKGIGGWSKQNSIDVKNKPYPTPFRPEFSLFRHCLKYRKQGSKVVSNCAIKYLDFLWKRTVYAHCEMHATRILSRLGVFKETDPHDEKVLKFNSLLTNEKPISKHKRLVQLGKTVCLSDNPRCNICPIANHCAKSGLN